MESMRASPRHLRGVSPVCRGSQEHTGAGRDTRSGLFQDRRHYVWDNHSDTSTLRDDRGRTVDTDSWAATTTAVNQAAHIKVRAT